MNNSNTILQIVPRRSLAPDGVGDYAARLAGELSDRHGLDTVFVAGTPALVGEKADDGWPTVWIKSRTSSDFTDVLQNAQKQWNYSTVIIHVVGYGYQNRGVPYWLLNSMRRWRRDNPDLRLVGVFHELYAQGRVWNSSFWLSDIQKRITYGLWMLCDSGLTTNSRYLGELKSWRPKNDAPIALMPVVSNVGEPESVPDVGSRPPSAMVFGLAGVGKTLYETHGRSVSAMCHRLGITRIIDIGVRHTPPPQDLDGIPVEAQGRLSADEVGDIAKDCRFGFLSYDVALLGKSTIFATCAANGMIPICIGHDGEPNDGLVAGRHFLDKPNRKLDLQDLQSIQTELLSWYRQHDLMRLGECVAAMCCSNSKFSRLGAIGAPAAEESESDTI